MHIYLTSTRCLAFRTDLDNCEFHLQSIIHFLVGRHSPPRCLVSIITRDFCRMLSWYFFYAYKLFTLYNCAFALFNCSFQRLTHKRADSFFLALLMNITNYHVRSRNSFKNNIMFASDYWFNLLIHIFIRICRICFISVC